MQCKGILISHKFGDLKVKWGANCEQNFRDVTFKQRDDLKLSRGDLNRVAFVGVEYLNGTIVCKLGAVERVKGMWPVLFLLLSIVMWL